MKKNWYCVYVGTVDVLENSRKIRAMHAPACFDSIDEALQYQAVEFRNIQSVVNSDKNSGIKSAAFSYMMVLDDKNRDQYNDLPDYIKDIINNQCLEYDPSGDIDGKYPHM